MQTTPNAHPGDDLDALIEEYVTSLRRGDHPSIEKFANRFPEKADYIRETLKTVEVMEQLALVDVEDVEDRGPGAQHGSALQVHSFQLTGQLGEYSIVREIGRGGMGIVYEAEQPSLGRRVALKVMPPAMAKHQHIGQRFRRESKAAAQLHHTNIVPIFSIGESDGLAYYAMQYIEGDSLDRVIDRIRELQRVEHAKLDATQQERPKGVPKTIGNDSTDLHFKTTLVLVDHTTVCTSVPEVSPTRQPAGNDSRASPLNQSQSSLDVQKLLSADASITKSEHAPYWHRIAQMGTQLASALAYAHAQRIYHRDIKPANVLLDQSGNVWLTDFGLAKLEDDLNLTATGDLLGTLRYIPPEAFAGTYDQRSEVYGAGLTLYELCCLRTAFEDSQRATLIDRIKRGEITRVHLRNPAVPIDLRTIIEKCLEPDPRDRYATAAALELDLRAFIADQPISARRISTFERVSRWARANRSLAMALGMIGALLAVLSVGALAVALLMIRVAQRTQQAAAENAHLADVAQRERQDAEGARRLAEKSRDEAIQANYAQAMSNAASNAIQGGRHLITQRILNTWRDAKMRWDPRGWEWHWLASAARQDSHLLFGHFADVRCVAFQPSGQLIASSGVSEGVRIWHRETGRELALIPQPLCVVVCWRPDGRTLLSASASGKIMLYDLDNGTSISQSCQLPDSDVVRTVAWHPSGGAVVISTDSLVEIRDVASWSLIAKTTHEGPAALAGPFRFAQWNPLASQIAVMNKHELVVMDGKLDSYKRVGTVEHDVQALRWLDDDRVQTIDRGGNLICWNVTTQVAESRVHCAVARDLASAAWNSDASQLAIAHDDHHAIVETQTGKLLKSWAPYTKLYSFFPQSVSWSDDDRCLSMAYAGFNSPVPIWNVDSIQSDVLHDAIDPRSVNDGPSPIRQFAWSADGTQIASLNDGVKIWDVSTRRLAKQLEMVEPPSDSPSIFQQQPTAIARDIQFSPDGKHLAATRWNAYVWDLTSERLIYAKRATIDECRGLAWSRDSKSLAISCSVHSPIMLLSVDDCSLRPLGLQSNFCSFLQWHPHHPWIAVGSGRQVVVWDAEKNAQAWSVPSDLEYENLSVWSRDGKRLATNAGESCVNLIDEYRQENGEVTHGLTMTLEGHSDLVRSLSWDCTGERLASVDKTGKAIVWDTVRGCKVLDLCSDAISVEWSPTAPILAVGRSSGDIQLLNADRSLRWEQLPHRQPGASENNKPEMSTAEALARGNQWSQIEQMGKDKCVQVGWWAIRPEDVAQWAERIHSHTQTNVRMHPADAQELLHWMQPAAAENGCVFCFPGASLLVSPIFCPDDAQVACVVGENYQVKSMSLNGQIVEMPPPLRPWRSTCLWPLKKGWNWLCVETQPNRSYETAFFEILLSVDSMDLEVARASEAVSNSGDGERTALRQHLDGLHIGRLNQRK